MKAQDFDIIKPYIVSPDYVLTILEQEESNEKFDDYEFFIKFKDNVDIDKLPIFPTGLTKFDIELDEDKVLSIEKGTVLNAYNCIYNPIEFIRANIEYIDFIFR